MCSWDTRTGVLGMRGMLTCSSLPRQLASRATRALAGGWQRCADGRVFDLRQAELGEEYTEFLRSGTSELLQSLPMQDSLPHTRFHQKRVSNTGFMAT